MNTTLMISLSLAGVLGMSFFARAADLPKVGTPAPDFSLLSNEGTPVQLSALQGQWVVLYFYPKDKTPGCSIEARNFARDQAEYQKRKAVVLGVSVDSVKSHKEFCTKENLNFRLLADTEKKVSAAYGSLTNLVVAKLSARHTFVIDPKGAVAAVFTDVKPVTHSKEVLDALDKLGAK